MNQIPSAPLKTVSANPRDRAHREEDFIPWIYEAMEAAYLGADVFERYFTIAGERMLCRVGFYWTDKADQKPRIGRLECLPSFLVEQSKDI